MEYGENCSSMEEAPIVSLEELYRRQSRIELYMRQCLGVSFPDSKVHPYQEYRDELEEVQKQISRAEKYS